MIDWLKQNRRVLNIRGIERLLKMRPFLLLEVLDGRMKLPEKWEKPLNKFIIKFGVKEDIKDIIYKHRTFCDICGAINSKSDNVICPNCSVGYKYTKEEVLNM